MNKAPVATLTTLVACALFASAAHAQTIAVDFVNGSDPTNQTPGISAVVGPYATAGWNNVVNAAAQPTPGSLALVDTNSNSTGATFGFTQGGNTLGGIPIYNSSHSIEGVANAGLNAEQQLFNGAVGATGNAATNGWTQELVLQGIPYAQYDVYLLVVAPRLAGITASVVGSVQNFNGGTLAGAGTTYYFANTWVTGFSYSQPPSTLPDPITYTQATGTTFGAATEGANYVRFSNLSSTNQTFDLLQASQPDTFQYNAFIGGFQIVAVPEPSTLMLLGSVGCGWVIFRRRRAEAR